MIICKHKDGGWYCAHFKGMFKMPTGEWVDTVNYQRIYPNKGYDEYLYTTFARTVDNFKASFTYYTIDAFAQEAIEDEVRRKNFLFNPEAFLRYRNPERIKYEDIS